MKGQVATSTMTENVRGNPAEKQKEIGGLSPVECTSLCENEAINLGHLKKGEMTIPRPF